MCLSPRPSLPPNDHHVWPGSQTRKQKLHGRQSHLDQSIPPPFSVRQERTHSPLFLFAGTQRSMLCLTSVSFVLITNKTIKPYLTSYQLCTRSARICFVMNRTRTTTYSAPNLASS